MSEDAKRAIIRHASHCERILLTADQLVSDRFRAHYLELAASHSRMAFEWAGVAA